MQTLANTVAIVTGGAQGLGAAICLALCEAGVHVVVADVRADPTHERVAALRDRGYRATALTLDVTDAAAAQSAVEQVARDHGRLDILVNNAGIDVTCPVEELTVGEWDRILAVNLRGPFVLAQAVFPLMRAAGQGHIVNIVSTAARRTWANATAYHASKWGLLGLSHALHVEGRPLGIKVTAILAGGMRTPFILERFPDTDPAVLQDPRTVAEAVRFALLQPDESVIPEMMVLPMRESSWP